MATDSFDHAVLMLASIDAAEDLARRLGFTATPRAVHPFGTGNVLAQFDDHTIEFLAVLDSAKVAADAAAFSFARFNRDFLARHGEGMAMTVVKAGQDAAAAGFGRAGIGAVPFTFSRRARAPDGREAEVGFDLTFAVDPLFADAGLFACRHRHPPEHFFVPAYQRHPNGARGVGAVLMTAADPAAVADRLALALGGARSSGDGRERILFGRDRIELLTPGAAAARYGVTPPPAAALRHLGLVVLVEDLATCRQALPAAAVATAEGLVVAPREAGGTLFVFAEP